METDVVVIGCGPAGIQAAIHAARKKSSTVLVGRARNSSAFGIKVENYFGFHGIQSGTELLSNGIEQARSFGCTVIEGNVLSMSRAGNGFTVSMENGESVTAKALVLATGMTRVKLGVPGEAKYSNGKGVSYCAVCDCNFYKGKVVALVGGESEAAVDSRFMTKYCSKVYWISPSFDVDASLIKSADDSGVIRIKSEVKEILGEDRVTSVRLSDGKEIPLDGVFIELGGKSSVDLAMDLDLMPEIDDTIKISRDCSTAVPGLFACGDITGRPWQIAKAVGEGAIAGLSAADYSKKVGQ